MDNSTIPVIPKISDPSMITNYNHITTPSSKKNDSYMAEKPNYSYNENYKGGRFNGAEKSSYVQPNVSTGSQTIVDDDVPSLQPEKNIFGINKKVFVILVVVLLVLIIAAIIYFYFFYKKDEQPPNNPPYNHQQQSVQRPSAVKRTAAPPNPRIVQNAPPSSNVQPINIHEENLADVSMAELDKIIKNENRPEITTEVKDGVKIFSSKINSGEESVISKMKNENEEFINDDIRKVMNNEINLTSAEDDKFDKLMEERMKIVAADVEENDEHVEDKVAEDNAAEDNEYESDKSIVCGAINKTTGKACNRKPTANSDRCQWHKKRDK